jgi:hypothetical protein
MNRTRLILLATGLAAVMTAFVPLPGAAQDTHYWNTQYGPRSMLLSGSVIGSVHDMSATYYNPGNLGYIEKPSLLLSANVYAISSLTVRDGGGDGIDLEANEFNLLPNMLAGAFRKSWLGKNKLAYSFLTRYRFKSEVRGARTDRIDVLDQYPGEEDFAGGLKVSSDTSELWAGITWSRGTGELIGYGVTTYLSIRSMDSGNELFAQALSDSGQMALYYDLHSYDSSVYSFLWKAGVGINLDPVTLGITVTTPNLEVSGSGRAVANRSHVGVDMDDDGTIEDGFTATVQEDIGANYHSPLSIGAGAAYHAPEWSVNVSAEWFEAVDSYDVLELSPFVSQETGETIVPSRKYKAKSVLNYAAGFEHDGSRYGGYLSFNTDFSSFDPESDVSVTGFDIYHVTAGTNIVFGRTKFMLGLGYAWGSELINQPINLNPGDDDKVVDPDDQVELVYSSLNFMLGFTVNL